MAYLVHQVSQVLWVQWVLLGHPVNQVLVSQGRQACPGSPGSQVHLVGTGLLDPWVCLEQKAILEPLGWECLESQVIMVLLVCMALWDQRGTRELLEHLENQVAQVMENQV